MQAYDYLFKIVVAGEPNVGKRSLINRYVNDIYSEDGSSRMNECTVKTVQVLNKTAKLNIYNTQGLEKQREIGESYYGGVHAAMVCFDSTDMYTLNAIVDLSKLIERYSKDAEFLLVQNKSDMDGGIDDNDIQSVADTISSHGQWIKTSSKTGENVAKAFEKIVELLVEKEMEKINAINHGFNGLNDKKKKKSNSKKKCVLL